MSERVSKEIRAFLIGAMIGVGAISIVQKAFDLTHDQSAIIALLIVVMFFPIARRR